MSNYNSFLAPLEIKHIKAQGSFSGYASIFHVMDLHHDQVMPGAFKFSLERWMKKQRWPFLLWQHNLSEPIGYWTHIQEDQKGLFVEGQLLLEIQRGKEAYSLIKKGVVEGLSIGFRPIVTRKDKTQRVRKLFQVDLVEISLVTLAANPEARLQEVKGQCNNSLYP